jgi:hypothetical protein
MSFHMRLRMGLSVLILSCFASTAFAVDGIILIDQARAMAGGITPGDGPGFPISLTQPGSYRLSGNLNVPANAPGITISTSGVTLDLNGFQIAGSNAGTGIFAAFAHRGITVRNGSVTRFVKGIDLNGNLSAVHGVRAFANTDVGIEVGAGATLTGNTVQDNGVGIHAGQSAVVRDNLAFFNRSTGIELEQFSVVTGNASNFNGNVGLEVGCPSSVSSNVAQENTARDLLFVFSGCQGEHNLPAATP